MEQPYHVLLLKLLAPLTLAPSSEDMETLRALRLHVFYELQEHGAPIKSLQVMAISPETYRNHLTQGALSSLWEPRASKPTRPPGLRDWTTKVNPACPLLLWPDRLWDCISASQTQLRRHADHPVHWVS